MSLLVLPYEILETIQNQVTNINIHRKNGDTNTMGKIMTDMLQTVDGLVSRSYDQYIDLEVLPDGLETNFPDRVTWRDISRANQLVGSTLVRMVSGELMANDEQDDERMEMAARLLAHLSGRGAAGALTRTWHFPFLDANGDLNQLQIKLHEPSYIGNDIGFKTWGAAPLLAKKLLQQNIIPDIQHREVLELGTGTGLVGLVCEKLKDGLGKVTVTDYHPSVLKNVAINVELNHSTCQVSKLDFIQVATSIEETEWNNRTFSIVIASDLLYEMEHAEYLPVAVEKLMENDFYFMIPLRDTHWKEVNRFEEKMIQVGLIQRMVEDKEIQEDEGIVRYR
ncbi:putative methyltransferase-domain-containing protein [Halteromyces radiatus]|uniref:putative methyltransferase-domain-containing protein n=1 Tax=Halteromyces radiatus TaxID=101107 RepID=UPI00221FFDD9|nr:putative methyltransferase-domain-containing protein [Halteromyces radiatus]KAI8078717.1 putative methyltransferase-domain-containing protein [Halteromyces radiatus]